ncbi:MAG TPA: ADP-polyphosphate phosphotransferase [Burkholderiales bacterium]|nr:ADP-polyphosphate phosphotransferase [Burkholderiales bacterium]
MKLRIKDFRVEEGAKLELRKHSTRIDALYESKADYEELLAQQKSELAHLQNLQYAHDRYALLLIFQAMDAAGKDGAIKHVMSGINPAGCEVTSFKQPSEEELDHDFLWRTAKRLPERGRIGIFNRSYYEDVLVVRVHKEILQGQKLPDEVRKDPDLWKHRYRSIVDLERHLHRNGTRVVKFFLNISKNEQRKRFLARIDDPEKNWKFNAGDVKDRKHWKQYMKAYEACLEATSTDEAPWYVIPADDKPNARLIISEVISETLKGLKMSYPQMSEEHLKELQVLRKQLSK